MPSTAAGSHDRPPSRLISTEASPLSPSPAVPEKTTVSVTQLPSAGELIVSVGDTVSALALPDLVDTVNAMGALCPSLPARSSATATTL